MRPVFELKVHSIKNNGPRDPSPTKFRAFATSRRVLVYTGWAGGEEIYLASDLGGTANKQEDHRPLDKGHSDNPQSAGFIEACVVWVGSKSEGINCKIHKKASLAIRYCAYTWW